MQIVRKQKPVFTLDFFLPLSTRPANPTFPSNSSLSIL